MGIIGKAFRSSSNLQSPTQWLVDFFSGGSVSESGIAINEDTAISESAVWCALSFLAGNIASLPCPVLKTDGRKREKQKGHYLHQRLNVMANPETPAMIWRETCLYYLFLWGTSISIIERTNLGEIAAIWPVHPDRIEASRRVNGRLQTDITLDSGRLKTFDQEDLLRIPGMGNGIFGLSMLEHSKNSLGLMLAMRSYANMFFKNGANMGVILEHPKSLGEKAHTNLTKSMTTAYAGLGKSHKLMIAEEGMKVQKAGTEPDKSQLIEGRKFSITDVARWFNLPPHVLKDLSQSNYSNMQQQSLELVIYTFRPIFVRLEQCYESFLLRDHERENLSVRHNAKALLRGDDAARGEYYKMRFATGSLTPNDIKVLEDENPIDEPWADKTYLQLNLVPSDTLAEISKPAQEGRSVEKRSIEHRTADQIAKSRDRIANRYEPLIKDAVQKTVNRETIAIGRELKKYLQDRGNHDFENWLVEFYDSFPKYLERDVRPLIVAYSESLQDVISAEIDMDDYSPEDIAADITNFTDGYIRQYIGSSRGQLLSILQEQEAIGVQQRLDEWQEKRAPKEASGLKTDVMGMAARAVILGGGYKLIWRNRSAKACPLCQQLNGRVVSRKTQAFTDDNEDFTDNDGKNVTFRRTIHPQLHKGCTCVLVAG